VRVVRKRLFVDENLAQFAAAGEGARLRHHQRLDVAPRSHGIAEGDEVVPAGKSRGREGRFPAVQPVAAGPAACRRVGIEERHRRIGGRSAPRYGRKVAERHTAAVFRADHQKHAAEGGQVGVKHRSEAVRLLPDEIMEEAPSVVEVDGRGVREHAVIDHRPAAETLRIGEVRPLVPVVRSAPLRGHGRGARQVAPMGDLRARLAVEVRFRGQGHAVGGDRIEMDERSGRHRIRGQFPGPDDHFAFADVERRAVHQVRVQRARAGFQECRAVRERGETHHGAGGHVNPHVAAGVERVEIRPVREPGIREVVLDLRIAVFLHQVRAHLPPLRQGELVRVDDALHLALAAGAGDARVFLDGEGVGAAVRRQRMHFEHVRHRVRGGHLRGEIPLLAVHVQPAVPDMRRHTGREKVILPCADTAAINGGVDSPSEVVVVARRPHLRETFGAAKNRVPAAPIGVHDVEHGADIRDRLVPHHAGLHSPVVGLRRGCDSVVPHARQPVVQIRLVSAGHARLHGQL